MRLKDFFALPPVDRGPVPQEKVDLLWPGARGELWAFAAALERGQAGITADHVRLAVCLADEAVAARKGG
jgi:hypothetical protein